MCAQTTGAIFAAGLVLIIAQGSPEGFAATGLAPNGYGLHSPAGYSLLSGFLAETILTMLLVLTVLGSTDVKAPVGFAGIAIGLVLVLIHLIAIPITNASVNPARSIASALFVGGWGIAAAVVIHCRANSGRDDCGRGLWPSAHTSREDYSAYR